MMEKNKLTGEAIKLHRRKAAPTVYTCTVPVTACANARDLRGALRVFAGMKAARVPPDAVTFNTLLKSVSQSGFYL